MSTSEPELSPTVAEAKGLRTGWTTGTCASAAAKAATVWLVTGAPPNSIEVSLPAAEKASFDVADASPDEPHKVAVIKDAGDDPDCTDGAHITAKVTWAESQAGDVKFVAGPGVGTVTKPGLGLEVGGPAINPVPRRMITKAVAEVTTKAVVCEISVPNGEKMAEKTSNSRLGILGGISILGTTGIVKPFSTASYRASVVQQIEVAASQREKTLVLSTGSRTDSWAQSQWPELDQVCFIEVGDFTGIALRKAAGSGVAKVRFVGMAGKIAKLAAGIMMTHFHRSKVDTKLLAEVARQAGSSPGVVKAATETATARHFFEVCQSNSDIEPLRRLCVTAAKNCSQHAGNQIKSEVIMIDFAGEAEVCRG